DIEIVGVVKDSKHATVRDKVRPFVCLPYSQFKTVGNITFYVKTRQDLGAVATSLRREVQRLDANLPVFDLKTLEGQIGESVFAGSRNRFCLASRLATHWCLSERGCC